MIGLLAVGSLLYTVTRLKSPTGTVTNSSNNSVFCSSDGSLSSEQSIQSHRSYCLTTETTAVDLNQPSTVTFQIIDDRGVTLKDFDTVHEKIMHVILVRHDLTNFQHIHPDFDQGSGTFTLNDLTISADGPYQLFADFTPTASPMGPAGSKLPVVDNVEFTAGSLAKYTPSTLGTANESNKAGSYVVKLAVSPPAPKVGQTTTLNFSVTENGAAVTNLEQYLGELGHAVVLRENDLSFLHAHAMNQDVNKQTGTIAFAVDFPEAGRYKTFVQFQHRGQVKTAEFVLPGVEASSESSTPPEDGMAH